jgi:hypothetical protein
MVQQVWTWGSRDFRAAGGQTQAGQAHPRPVSAVWSQVAGAAGGQRQTLDIFRPLGNHFPGPGAPAGPALDWVRSPRWPHCSTQPRPTAHSLVKGWNVHSLTLDSLNVSSRYYREKPHVHVHVHTTYREASRPRMPPPTAHNSSSP